MPFGPRIEWNGSQGKPEWLDPDEFIKIKGSDTYGTYLGPAGRAMWDYLTTNFYLREDHPHYCRVAQLVEQLPD